MFWGLIFSIEIHRKIIYFFIYFDQTYNGLLIYFLNIPFNLSTFRDPKT